MIATSDIERPDLMIFGEDGTSSPDVPALLRELERLRSELVAATDQKTTGRSQARDEAKLVAKDEGKALVEKTSETNALMEERHSTHALQSNAALQATINELVQEGLRQKEESNAREADERQRLMAEKLERNMAEKMEENNRLMKEVYNRENEKYMRDWLEASRLRVDEMLEERGKKTDDEIARLKTGNATLTAKVDELDSEIRGLNSSNESLRESVELLNKTLNTVIEALDRLTQKCAELADYEQVMEVASVRTPLNDIDFFLLCPDGDRRKTEVRDSVIDNKVL
jgi:chromosome segregation ATPase